VASTHALRAGVTHTHEAPQVPLGVEVGVLSIHVHGRHEMKKRFALLTVGALGAIGLFAPSAGAAGQVCYDVQVNAAGQSVISQTGCQDLP
jgi:hypothetical protein